MEVTFTYPLTNEFIEMLIQYVLIESRALYRRQDSNVREALVQDRILRLLMHIFNAHYESRMVPSKEIFEKSAKAIINMFIEMKRDYGINNRLMENMTIKLLKKTGHFEKVVALKGKNLPCPLDTYLTDPVYSDIYKTTITSDYGTDDGLHVDDDVVNIVDDDDIIDVSANECNAIKEEKDSVLTKTLLTSLTKPVLTICLDDSDFDSDEETFCLTEEVKTSSKSLEYQRSQRQQHRDTFQKRNHRPMDEVKTEDVIKLDLSVDNTFSDTYSDSVNNDVSHSKAGLISTETLVIDCDGSDDHLQSGTISSNMTKLSTVDEEIVEISDDEPEKNPEIQKNLEIKTYGVDSSTYPGQRQTETMVNNGYSESHQLDSCLASANLNTNTEVLQSPIESSIEKSKENSALTIDDSQSDLSEVIEVQPTFQISNELVKHEQFPPQDEKLVEDAFIEESNIGEVDSSIREESEKIECMPGSTDQCNYSNDRKHRTKCLSGDGKLVEKSGVEIVEDISDVSASVSKGEESNTVNVEVYNTSERKESEEIKYMPEDRLSENSSVENVEAISDNIPGSPLEVGELIGGVVDTSSKEFEEITNMPNSTDLTVHTEQNDNSDIKEFRNEEIIKESLLIAEEESGNLKSLAMNQNKSDDISDVSASVSKGEESNTVNVEVYNTSERKESEEIKYMPEDRFSENSLVENVEAISDNIPGSPLEVGELIGGVVDTSSKEFEEITNMPNSTDLTVHTEQNDNSDIKEFRNEENIKESLLIAEEESGKLKSLAMNQNKSDDISDVSASVSKGESNTVKVEVYNTSERKESEEIKYMPEDRLSENSLVENVEAISVNIPGSPLEVGELIGGVVDTSSKEFEEITNMPNSTDLTVHTEQNDNSDIKEFRNEENIKESLLIAEEESGNLKSLAMNQNKSDDILQEMSSRKSPTRGDKLAEKSFVEPISDISGSFSEMKQSNMTNFEVSNSSKRKESEESFTDFSVDEEQHKKSNEENITETSTTTEQFSSTVCLKQLTTKIDSHNVPKETTITDLLSTHQENFETNKVAGKVGDERNLKEIDLLDEHFLETNHLISPSKETNHSCSEVVNFNKSLDHTASDSSMSFNDGPACISDVVVDALNSKTLDLVEESKISKEGSFENVDKLESISSTDTDMIRTCDFYENEFYESGNTECAGDKNHTECTLTLKQPENLDGTLQLDEDESGPPIDIDTRQNLKKLKPSLDRNEICKLNNSSECADHIQPKDNEVTVKLSDTPDSSLHFEEKTLSVDNDDSENPLKIVLEKAIHEKSLGEALVGTETNKKTYHEKMNGVSVDPLNLTSRDSYESNIDISCDNIASKNLLISETLADEANETSVDPVSLTESICYELGDEIVYKMKKDTGKNESQKMTDAKKTFGKNNKIFSKKTGEENVNEESLAGQIQCSFTQEIEGMCSSPVMPNKDEGDAAKDNHPMLAKNMGDDLNSLKSTALESSEKIINGTEKHLGTATKESAGMLYEVNAENILLEDTEINKTDETPTSHPTETEINSTSQPTEHQQILPKQNDEKKPVSNNAAFDRLEIELFHDKSGSSVLEVPTIDEPGKTFRSLETSVNNFTPAPQQQFTSEMNLDVSQDIEQFDEKRESIFPGATTIDITTDKTVTPNSRQKEIELNTDGMSNKNEEKNDVPNELQEPKEIPVNNTFNVEDSRSLIEPLQVSGIAKESYNDEQQIEFHEDSEFVMEVEIETDDTEHNVDVNLDTDDSRPNVEVELAIPTESYYSQNLTDQIERTVDSKLTNSIEICRVEEVCIDSKLRQTSLIKENLSLHSDGRQNRIRPSEASKRLKTLKVSGTIEEYRGNEGACSGYVDSKPGKQEHELEELFNAFSSSGKSLQKTDVQEEHILEFQSGYALEVEVGMKDNLPGSDINSKVVVSDMSHQDKSYELSDEHFKGAANYAIIDHTIKREETLIEDNLKTNVGQPQIEDDKERQNVLAEDTKDCDDETSAQRIKENPDTVTRVEENSHKPNEQVFLFPNESEVANEVEIGSEAFVSDTDVKDMEEVPCDNVDEQLMHPKKSVKGNQDQSGVNPENSVSSSVRKDFEKLSNIESSCLDNRAVHMDISLNLPSSLNKNLDEVFIHNDITIVPPGPFNRLDVLANVAVNALRENALEEKEQPLREKDIEEQKEDFKEKNIEKKQLLRRERSSKGGRGRYKKISPQVNNNIRITRSKYLRNTNENIESGFKPHDFLSLENSIPPANKIYADKIVDIHFTSEDSNDSESNKLLIDEGSSSKSKEIKSKLLEQCKQNEVSNIDQVSEANAKSGFKSLPDKEENEMCRGISNTCEVERTDSNIFDEDTLEENHHFCYIPNSKPSNNEIKVALIHENEPSLAEMEKIVPVLRSSSALVEYSSNTPVEGNKPIRTKAERKAYNSPDLYIIKKFEEENVPIVKQRMSKRLDTKMKMGNNKNASKGVETKKEKILKNSSGPVKNDGTKERNDTDPSEDSVSLAKLSENTEKNEEKKKVVDSCELGDFDEIPLAERIKKESQVFETESNLSAEGVIEGEKNSRSVRKSPKKRGNNKTTTRSNIQVGSEDTLEKSDSRNNLVNINIGQEDQLPAVFKSPATIESKTTTENFKHSNSKYYTSPKLRRKSMSTESLSRTDNSETVAISSKIIKDGDKQCVPPPKLRAKASSHCEGFKEQNTNWKCKSTVPSTTEKLRKKLCEEVLPDTTEESQLKLNDSISKKCNITVVHEHLPQESCEGILANTDGESMTKFCGINARLGLQTKPENVGSSFEEVIISSSDDIEKKSVDMDEKSSVCAYDDNSNQSVHNLSRSSQRNTGNESGVEKLSVTTVGMKENPINTGQEKAFTVADITDHQKDDKGKPSMSNDICSEISSSVGTYEECSPDDKKNIGYKSEDASQKDSLNGFCIERKNIVAVESKDLLSKHSPDHTGAENSFELSSKDMSSISEQSDSLDKCEKQTSDYSEVDFPKVGNTSTDDFSLPSCIKYDNTCEQNEGVTIIALKESSSSTMSNVSSDLCKNKNELSISSKDSKLGDTTNNVIFNVDNRMGTEECEGVQTDITVNSRHTDELLNRNDILERQPDVIEGPTGGYTLKSTSKTRIKKRKYCDVSPERSVQEKKQKYAKSEKNCSETSDECCNYSTQEFVREKTQKSRMKNNDSADTKNIPIIPKLEKVLLIPLECFHKKRSLYVDESKKLQIKKAESNKKGVINELLPMEDESVDKMNASLESINTKTRNDAELSTKEKSSNVRNRTKETSAENCSKREKVEPIERQIPESKMRKSRRLSTSNSHSGGKKSDAFKTEEGQGERLQLEYISENSKSLRRKSCSKSKSSMQGRMKRLSYLSSTDIAMETEHQSENIDTETKIGEGNVIDELISMEAGSVDKMKACLGSINTETKNDIQLSIKGKSPNERSQTKETSSEICSKREEVVHEEQHMSTSKVKKSRLASTSNSHASGKKSAVPKTEKRLQLECASEDSISSRRKSCSKLKSPLHITADNDESSKASGSKETKKTHDEKFNDVILSWENQALQGGMKQLDPLSSSVIAMETEHQSENIETEIKIEDDMIELISTEEGSVDKIKACLELLNTKTINDSELSIKGKSPNERSQTKETSSEICSKREEVVHEEQHMPTSKVKKSRLASTSNSQASVKKSAVPKTEKRLQLECASEDSKSSRRKSCSKLKSPLHITADNDESSKASGSKETKKTHDEQLNEVILSCENQALQGGTKQLDSLSSSVIAMETEHQSENIDTEIKIEDDMIELISTEEGSVDKMNACLELLNTKTINDSELSIKGKSPNERSQTKETSSEICSKREEVVVEEQHMPTSKVKKSRLASTSNSHASVKKSAVPKTEKRLQLECASEDSKSSRRKSCSKLKSPLHITADNDESSKASGSKETKKTHDEQLNEVILSCENQALQGGMKQFDSLSSSVVAMETEHQSENIDTEIKIEDNMIELISTEDGSVDKMNACLEPLNTKTINDTELSINEKSPNVQSRKKETLAENCGKRETVGPIEPQIPTSKMKTSRLSSTLNSHSGRKKNAEKRQDEILQLECISENAKRSRRKSGSKSTSPLLISADNDESSKDSGSKGTVFTYPDVSGQIISETKKTHKEVNEVILSCENQALQEQSRSVSYTDIATEIEKQSENIDTETKINEDDMKESIEVSSTSDIKLCLSPKSHSDIHEHIVEAEKSETILKNEKNEPHIKSFFLHEEISDKKPTNQIENQSTSDRKPNYEKVVTNSEIVITSSRDPKTESDRNSFKIDDAAEILSEHDVDDLFHGSSILNSPRRCSHSFDSNNPASIQKIESFTVESGILCSTDNSPMEHQEFCLENKGSSSSLDNINKSKQETKTPSIESDGLSLLPHDSQSEEKEASSFSEKICCDSERIDVENQVIHQSNELSCEKAQHDFELEDKENASTHQSLNKVEQVCISVEKRSSCVEISNDANLEINKLFCDPDSAEIIIQQDKQIFQEITTHELKPISEENSCGHDSPDNVEVIHPEDKKNLVIHTSDGNAQNAQLDTHLPESSNYGQTDTDLFSTFIEADSIRVSNEIELSHTVSEENLTTECICESEIINADISITTTDSGIITMTEMECEPSASDNKCNFDFMSDFLKHERQTENVEITGDNQIYSKRPGQTLCILRYPYINYPKESKITSESNELSDIKSEQICKNPPEEMNHNLSEAKMPIIRDVVEIGQEVVKKTDELEELLKHPDLLTKSRKRKPLFSLEPYSEQIKLKKSSMRELSIVIENSSVVTKSSPLSSSPRKREKKSIESVVNDLKERDREHFNSISSVKPSSTAPVKSEWVEGGQADFNSPWLKSEEIPVIHSEVVVFCDQPAIISPLAKSSLSTDEKSIDGDFTEICENNFPIQKTALEQSSPNIAQVVDCNGEIVPLNFLPPEEILELEYSGQERSKASNVSSSNQKEMAMKAPESRPVVASNISSVDVNVVDTFRNLKNLTRLGNATFKMPSTSSFIHTTIETSHPNSNNAELHFVKTIPLEPIADSNPSFGIIQPGPLSVSDSLSGNEDMPLNYHDISPSKISMGSTQTLEFISTQNYELNQNSKPQISRPNSFITNVPEPSNEMPVIIPVSSYEGNNSDHSYYFADPVMSVLAEDDIFLNGISDASSKCVSNDNPLGDFVLSDSEEKDSEEKDYVSNPNDDYKLRMDNDSITQNLLNLAMSSRKEIDKLYCLLDDISNENCAGPTRGTRSWDHNKEADPSPQKVISSSNHRYPPPFLPHTDLLETDQIPRGDIGQSDNHCVTPTFNMSHSDLLETDQIPRGDIGQSDNHCVTPTFNMSHSDLLETDQIPRGDIGQSDNHCETPTFNMSHNDLFNPFSVIPPEQQHCESSALDVKHVSGTHTSDSKKECSTPSANMTNVDKVGPTSAIITRDAKNDSKKVKGKKSIIMKTEKPQKGVQIDMLPTRIYSRTRPSKWIKSSNQTSNNVSKEAQSSSVDVQESKADSANTSKEVVSTDNLLELSFTSRIHPEKSIAIKNTAVTKTSPEVKPTKIENIYFNHHSTFGNVKEQAAQSTVKSQYLKFEAEDPVTETVHKKLKLETPKVNAEITAIEQPQKTLKPLSNLSMHLLTKEKSPAVSNIGKAGIFLKDVDHTELGKNPQAYVKSSLNDDTKTSFNNTNTTHNPKTTDTTSKTEAFVPSISEGVKSRKRTPTNLYSTKAYSEEAKISSHSRPKRRKTVDPLGSQADVVDKRCYGRNSSRAASQETTPEPIIDPLRNRSRIGAKTSRDVNPKSAAVNYSIDKILSKDNEAANKRHSNGYAGENSRDPERRGFKRRTYNASDKPGVGKADDHEDPFDRLLKQKSVNSFFSRAKEKVKNEPDSKERSFTNEKPYREREEFNSKFVTPHDQRARERDFRGNYPKQHSSYQGRGGRDTHLPDPRRSSSNYYPSSESNRQSCFRQANWHPGNVSSRPSVSPHLQRISTQHKPENLKSTCSPSSEEVSWAQKLVDQGVLPPPNESSPKFFSMPSHK